MSSSDFLAHTAILNRLVDAFVSDCPDTIAEALRDKALPLGLEAPLQRLLNGDESAVDDIKGRIGAIADPDRFLFLDTLPPENGWTNWMARAVHKKSHVTLCATQPTEARANALLLLMTLRSALLDDAQLSWNLTASVWWRASTQEWVLETEGTIGDTHLVSRHTQPAGCDPRDVPGLPGHYAAEGRNDALEAALSWLLDTLEDDSEAASRHDAIKAAKAALAIPRS